MRKFILATTSCATSLCAQDASTSNYPSSARLSAQHGAQMTFSADWLYWKTSETGLSYVMKQEGFNPNFPEFMGFGNLIDPKFAWRSGFRAGLGYNIPSDQWLLNTTWTWYEGKAESKTHASGGDILFPTLIHPNVFNDENIFSCNDSHADLLLHVNIIDLNLGRPCQLGKKVTFHPYIGLRNAWLYQTYDIDYDDLFYYNTNDFALEPALDNYFIRMINDFWGFGPRSGCDMDFKLGGDVSLFGGFTLSLLYGTFQISHAEHFQTHTDEGVMLSEKSHFHAGRFITDLRLGTRWSRSFHKERFRILLEASWEHHLFFSQNQMIRFVDGQNFGTFVQNQGDLYLQGWQLGFTFYF